jgi:FkbH-like protein
MNLTFNELRKQLKTKHSDFPKLNVALLGDSSTQLLNKAISGQAISRGYQLSVYEADYNQIDLQIMNPNSELYENSTDFIIIAESSQKLKSNFYKLEIEERKQFADQKIKQIKQIINQIISLKPIKSIIYFNFQPEDDSIFGNFANQTPYSFLYQIRKLNFELMNLSISEPVLSIIDYAKIHLRCGDKLSFSPQMYVNNDMVYSLDVLPVISKNILDIMLAQSGIVKKCLILDLDNTMWGGVIGDDGIENIEIGNLGIGKAFTNFQLWAKALKDRGIILAVCSKNYEHIAKDVFENHPEMVIRLEDISVFVANWENKADNIRHIQNVLNIGFDSMVFIDDNKFERELVKSNLPEVTVPDLPEDPAEYVDYLKNLNLFETASFVKNDIERTKQYQAESIRKQNAEKFNSTTDFLKDLEMIAEISEFNKFNLPRVSQLIQRSNQFNLRTKRYTEQQLKNMQNSNDYICFSVSLKDKYGDYGLISVIILKVENNHFFIDTWVMSCRVLKRDVEKYIINYIVNLTKEYKNINKIIGEYLPTNKNGLVKDLYKNLGFHKNKDLWELQIDNYQNQKHYIQS